MKSRNRIFFLFIAVVTLIISNLIFSSCQEEKPVEIPVVKESPRLVADSLIEVGREIQFNDKPKIKIPLTFERQWDSLQELSFTDTFLSPNGRDPKFKVFGWHPYFYGSAYKSYNFELLWGVSYFGYLIDSKTGSYRNIYQWKETKLIKMAHANGCKVFLTLINFGFKQNDSFLTNFKAWKTCADSCIALLKYKGADGINIDFESVSSNRRVAFNAFIKYFKGRLLASNKKWQLSLCLYSVDWNNLFDGKKLNRYINFYTLMGYDYHYSGSKTAGPISPLRSGQLWSKYTLENSLKAYKKKHIDFKKLIIGLPYYGAEWEVSSFDLPSKSKGFVRHHVYRNYQMILDSLKMVKRLEPWSISRYYSYSKDSSNWQVWADDKYTLSRKYDWIKSNNLMGVGIWALGYDNGYRELWELLDLKFSKPLQIPKPKKVVKRRK